MKLVMVMILSLLVVAENGMAQFKMPKRVYRMDQLDKARAEAESKGRAMTFIMTQESSSCPLCASASLNAAEVLGKKTVVVYVNSATEQGKLPAMVLKALWLPEAGGFLPKTAILDAAFTNIIATVPYAQGAEQQRLLKLACKKLPNSSMKPGTSPAPGLRASSTPYSIPPAADREMRTWQSASGASMEGAVIHERNGRVAIRKRGGTTVEMACANLCKNDQEYLQQIRSESSGNSD